jgi:hypothetical protein
MSYEGGKNIPGTSSSPTTSGESSNERIRQYHTPTFVHYGELSQLVQNNPSTGSDGGSGDCQHL